MEKMNKIGPMSDDLFTLNAETDILPVVEYPDIYNCLISTPSPYTKEDIQEPGWIQVSSRWLGGNVSLFQVSGLQHFMVWAKVRHSQTVSAQPANPWIAAKSGGPVIAAHCDCMAGLGEVCSHISALLFTIEAHTNFIKENFIHAHPNPASGYNQQLKLSSMHRCLRLTSPHREQKGKGAAVRMYQHQH